MRFFLANLLAAALLAALLPATAVAQAVVSTGQSFVTVRLLPGIGHEDGARTAGLRLSLAEGWKTYWRSPGEAGIPPHLDWSASTNLAGAELLWPRPELFQSFGLRTVGYSEQVVLPVRVTPKDPALPVNLVLTGDFGVCRDICVIERVELNATLEPGMRDVGGSQIRRALNEVPVPAAEVGVRHVACRFTGQGEELRLEAVVQFDDPLLAAEVVVEGTEKLWLRRSTSQIQDGALHVSAEAELPSGMSWIDRSAVRLTVLADRFAADIQGCKAPEG